MLIFTKVIKFSLELNYMINHKTTELYSRLLGFRASVDELRINLIALACTALFELRIDQARENKVKTIIDGLNESLDFFVNVLGASEDTIAIMNLTSTILDVSIGGLLRGDMVTHRHQKVAFPADHLLYEIRSSLVALVVKPQDLKNKTKGQQNNA